MSKVLVTGGAGYIGSVLVKDLIQEGYDVRVFDKFIFGKESLTGLENRIEMVQGDIRDFKPEILDKVSYIIHLAGFSNDPMAFYNPEANNQINTSGTRKLAEEASKSGIKRFTYASSASIYDKGLRGSNELQTEKSGVEPKAPYSISKYEGERELLKVMENNPDFSPVILRQGTIYGHSPRMRFDLVVNTFAKEAFKTGRLKVFCGGTQWRPLVDIKDVARAHIECLKAPEEKVKGEIFNVVQDNYQVWDIAHRTKWALKGIVNVDIDIDYQDDRVDRSYRISGEKLGEVLGFKYKRGVEESIRDIAMKIKEGVYGENLDNPSFNNIEWIKLLTEMKKKLDGIGNVF